jgi:hypothetical protein
MTVAHDPEIAEWMGLDPDIEGILLASAEVQPQSR